MLTGFVFQGEQLVATVDSIAALPDWIARPDAWFWLDLEAPDDDLATQVAALFRLDPEALEDCRRGDQRPRVDEFDDFIFLVLYGVPSPDEPGFEPHKLGVFLGQRFLITIHRDPMRSLGSVRDRVRRNTKGAVPRSVDGVLYVLVDALVDRYVAVVDTYDDQLEGLEESSLERHPPRRLLHAGADLRRKIHELHRIAVTQNEILTPLSQGEYDFVSAALLPRLGHVATHLTSVAYRLETLRERLNSVRDHYHTALTQHTNDVIKTLTIFTATLMPLSIVTGIYGMNLPLWPNPDHPATFWSILALMLAISSGLLFAFRRSRWL